MMDSPNCIPSAVNKNNFYWLNHGLQSMQVRVTQTDVQQHTSSIRLDKISC